ncbi:MAG: hypothetical protein JJE40_12475 [Vicinamibacteria bacterium]|nr:hypothetical protein [Vicinamibacteria bacterium]
MYSATTRLLAVGVLLACAVIAAPVFDATLANATGAAPQSGCTQQIDVAQRLSVRPAFAREVTTEPPPRAEDDRPPTGPADDDVGHPRARRSGLGRFC